MQCVELLSAHPHVEITRLLSRTYAGSRFSDVVPGSEVDLALEEGLDVDGADVIFAALPHTVAAAQARRWLSGGAVVVDMSADFRLRDAASYARWYGLDHPAPELCGESVYALVESSREALRSADLIAAPGCYPTACLLAALPAVSAGAVEPDIVIDAKSGVSGAGRSLALTSHFSEVNESVRAYGVGGHRHKAEMLEQLQAASGTSVRVTFVPHLIPMTRGILATVYLTPKAGFDEARVVALYEEYYAGQPFVRVVGEPPATKSVAGTNMAAVHCGWQDGTAVVTTAIDNLVKGASGQGIQAFNIRFGFEETAGLSRSSQWP
jgi:N-acetyl-gamma-glutamyl-phosphate reductase